MTKPITRKEWKELWSFVRGVAKQASNHDPEHSQELRDHDSVLADQQGWLLSINSRLDVLERQMERIGAPQYRKAR